METPLFSVTKERWLEAQQEERKYHDLSKEDGLAHYGRGYKTYLFPYLGITWKDMEGKSVLEIGPADFPALCFCENLGLSCVIEPMPSPILEELSVEVPFTVFRSPAEEMEFPFVNETWLFNVLTHVMNPDIIIEKAKECSDVIRFFEPVYTAITPDHPWTFDFQYYYDRFGQHINYYPPNDTVQGFHSHECVYGSWYHA